MFFLQMSYHEMAIDLFHHVLYFEYFRKTCGGSCINLYCVAMTYGRLRSGHTTREKGLLCYIVI